MKKGKKFGIEEYLKLDSDLSAITFNGISVTGIVGQFLKSSFNVVDYHPGSIKENLLWFYQYLRLTNPFIYRLKSKQLYKKDLTNKYWFVLTATDSRLLNQLLPVINKMGRDQCVIISTNNQYIEPVKDLFYSAPVLSGKEFQQWENQFAENRRRIKKQLEEIKEKYSLSNLATQLLYTNILYQTQLIFSFKKRVDEFHPKAVIVDSARQIINGALLSSANYRKVPTYELIHGSVSPPDNYIPFLTKKIFCWGKLQYNDLTSADRWNTKVIITGNPRIKRTYEHINKSKVEQVIHTGTNNVFLITNNIEMEMRLKYMEEYARATASLPGISAYVRLHLSEKISDYQTILDKYPHLTILENQALSMDETLYASNIVVMHNSTVGIEALVKSKIVVILDNIDYPLGLGETLIKEAGCERVTTHDELRTFITKVTQDSSYRESLLARQETFVHDYCSAYGDEAVENICNIITKDAN